jgi:DNA-directed RNA polymerase specialized sigma24 family protein
VSLEWAEQDGKCFEKSPEEALVDTLDEQEAAKRRDKRVALAKKALDSLTEIQRRRYKLHIIDGLTTRQIADKEVVDQRTVMDSLEWAAKKIKKFLKSEGK